MDVGLTYSSKLAEYSFSDHICSVITMYNRISRPRIGMEALPQLPDMPLGHTADTFLRLPN